MEFAEVERWLEAAICLFYRKDKYLLEVDASKRSITHRLGLHLQGLFKGWDVDCEYNRHWQNTKSLSRNESTSGKKKGSVFPDIIVHKRGSEGSNLLVVEAKKTHNIRDKEQDLRKLRLYKKELKYQYAAFLEVDTRKGYQAIKICWNLDCPD